MKPPDYEMGPWHLEDRIDPDAEALDIFRGAVEAGQCYTFRAPVEIFGEIVASLATICARVGATESHANVELRIVFNDVPIGYLTATGLSAHARAVAGAPDDRPPAALAARSLGRGGAAERARRTQDNDAER